ncbi:MAG: rhodanese-like domain-containing protein [Ignavibacteria bacterium]|nr:rhodanese-like domain-containing protein [Ignavibacteria bacterium]
MGFLTNLFGGSADTIKEALQAGAIVIDVRSPSEFSGGHVKGSTNVPLQEVGSWLQNQDKAQQIIFCCASGGRSGSATSTAKKAGFNVLNAGPWTNVR